MRGASERDGGIKSNYLTVQFFTFLSCEIISELCAVASFIFPPNLLTCSVTPSDTTKENHAPGLLEHLLRKPNFRLEITEFIDFYSLN